MKKSKQGVGNSSSSNTSSTSFIISKFIKYYWINIIIFVTIILILGLNLISVIMETKDHFDINRLLSELKSNSYVSTNILLPNIISISSRQRVSLISNTLILVIDFILFIFLCALILKRNFLSSSSSSSSSNRSLKSSGGILDSSDNNNESSEKDRLIIPSPITTTVTYLNNSTNSNFMNNNPNIPTTYNSLGHGSNNSNSGGGGGHSFFSLHHNNNNHNNNQHFNKGIVFCESDLFEPFNEITIEKIAGSSDDIKAIDKIRNTYYRYGITAAKLVYDRCIFFLTNDEKKEILKLFGLVDPTLLK